MYKVVPTSNLNTVLDGRGGIFTYVPKEAILEFNYIVTNKTSKRGFHFHEEFTEYILVVKGSVIYVELSEGKAWEDSDFLMLGPGECVCFPPGCAHTLVPLEDCALVALLTKKWDDCKAPITKVEV
jgi:dTDP-4-dehydrorhamnose 3,5-epimerase-like enzyme